MATSNGQRIGILAITVLMIASTIGMFAVMILSGENAQKDDAKLKEATAKYEKDQKAYEAKIKAQAEALSEKYYPTFSEYTGHVAAFDKDSVHELQTEDLLEGEGAEIAGDTAFAAYYVGWNPDGKVFDQSVENNALKVPLPVDRGLDNASLISGWKEGMKGMKIGGVRLITIPSDKAYGETGQGDDIPPNTPLKFVVMAVDKPEAIPQPQIPIELLQQYQRGMGMPSAGLQGLGL